MKTETQYVSGELPFEKIIEMLKSAKDTDGILIVITNGIDKPEEINPDGKCFVALHRPESCVQGLFNHAIQFGSFEFIGWITGHMRGIAMSTQENIDIVLNEQKNQN